jgi:HEAT repeat protein
MDPASEYTQDLDLKLLSDFIYEMNITRRYALSYPPDHPIITNAADKVIQQLAKLLESQSAVTLGIARNVLIFNSGVLDKKNPVYSDLAGYLFAHGIAVITFSRKMTGEELLSLFTALGADGENVRELGAAVRMLKEAGIVNIQVTEIDYRSFRVTEETELTAPGENILEHESAALWCRFVEGVMHGTLDSSGKKITSSEQIDPKRLAAFLNQSLARSADSSDSSYSAAITSFMRQLDRNNLASTYDAESVKKLGEFVKNLSPELRRQFLQSSFDSLQGGDTVRRLLTEFPDEVILDSISDVNDKGAHLSQGVVNLLQIISRTGTGYGPAKKTRGIQNLSHDELSEKLKNLFREDEPDRFVSESYRTTLQSIASIERFSVLADDEICELSGQIRSFPVESGIRDVILQIMNTDIEDGDVQDLQDNLMDLCEVFLNTGDYRSLAKVFLHIRPKSQDETFGILMVHQAVFARFMEPEFHEEILNGLALWGKAKYEDIRALILGIGDPFVEALIQRLAEESSMSLRRYYLDCLYEIGDAAKEAAILKLNDKRWYVVRNMVSLLRRFGDPAVVRHFRSIAGNSHPKVRQELIRVLFAFNHAEADNLLQKEFRSTDRERVLTAIQLAEQSRNPGTVECLRKILATTLFTAAEYELKQAAVKTLGKIANPVILPDLERILNQNSLFASTLLKRLKTDIVQSLENYRGSEVRALLEKLTRSGTGKLAPAAADVLKKVEARAL